jgi:S-adenosylmethionine decarboxylase
MPLKLSIPISFPPLQLFPHVHFDEEVRYLDQSFGQLGTGVYVADANHNCHVSPRPTYNVEVCMTDLSCSAAKQFFRSHKAAAEVTEGTGIRQIKPKAVIDDYVFEPCGYSMNGIDGSGLMTIHITPETGFSYASIEVSGCWDDVLCPADLLAKAVKIFEPAKISLALTVDKGVGKEAGKRRESSAQAGFGELAYLPCGYSTFSTSSQPLPGGGKVTYYNVALDRSSAPGSPITVLGVEGSSSSSAFTSDSDVEAELA